MADKDNKENGLACVVEPSKEYLAEYAAQIVGADGKVVASSPVVADRSLSGDVGSVFRGAVNLTRPAGDEILPTKFGVLTGDTVVPAGSVPVGEATQRLDGFRVDFDQNRCDVTGPQGQAWSARIAPQAPSIGPKP
jgi:hypothetical protein